MEKESSGRSRNKEERRVKGVTDNQMTGKGKQKRDG